MAEAINPYSERVMTVIGGKGALGSKIVTALEPLGFREVQICEAGDPFLDFAKRSTDLFFAVPDTEIKAMLQSSRDYLTPKHTILDGSSVKAPLITTYRELDGMQISVASTHLGAVPSQPWRGIKVWVCEVGPNSERAKRLAFDLFLSTNSSIRTIKIEDHRNVEIDQFLTMAFAHIIAATLRKANYTLGNFDLFATLNAELQALPVGRTLGQGTRIPSEIIFNQPMREEYMERIKEGVRELEAVLEDRDKLQAWMQQNINFHNQDGVVDSLFKKAGVIGARNANLRMHRFSFRITNDQPGLLSKVLGPFHVEGANLTAIDSMPGIATDEEIARGVDPDKIVDFDIGIDPKTIDEDKEQRIKRGLVALGCTVS
jgi:prephenate dehydrogenase